MYGRFLNYILLIDGKYWYIGCHCLSHGISKYNVESYSGNPLMNEVRKGKMSHHEYHERVKLVKVKEFETKEEAKESEEKLIVDYLNEFGSYCLNKRKGDKGYLVKRSKRRSWSRK